MARKVFLIVMVLAVIGAVTVAQEKKFESLKDCMMCLKMNRDKAGKAMEDGDMEAVAAAAGAMKDATMCMNKDFCTGDDFANCGKSFCEAIEKLEKAAKDGDKAAAEEAMASAKKGCMGCHEKCKK
ncbi:MAG: hypothetical protein AB1696_24705 [Planctomycetota bacterium]